MKTHPRPTNRLRALRGRIAARGYTQKGFASALGVSSGHMSALMNKKADWRMELVWRACDLLGIRENEIHQYWPRPKEKPTDEPIPLEEYLKRDE